MKKTEISNKQKAIIGVAILIAVFAVVFLGIKIKNNINKASEESKIPEIYTVPEKEKIYVDGKVMPVKSKNFFEDSNKGDLDSIAVEDGQKVDEGQTLFTYKNEKDISEIDTLKETVKLKEEQLNTIQDENMKESLDEEISKLNNQISGLEDRKYESINAPFAGKVYINQQTTEGQISPIMTLESENFYVQGQVSESELSKINLNQEVEVLINSTKEKFKGKITSIGERPSSDKVISKKDSKQNLSYYDIKINFLENQDLKNIKNGFHVKTTIEVLNNPIKVPYTSLLQEDERKFVYKVIDGIIYKQEVKTGEVNDEYAVITEGVGENDKVIKFANSDIKEGESIYPSKENEMKD